MALLEASSLGTPAARQIQSAVPADVAEDVRRRRAERHPPEPAACQQPATVSAETTPGSRQDKAGPEVSQGRGRPVTAGTKWFRWGVIPVAAVLVIIVAVAIAAAVFTGRANRGENAAVPTDSAPNLEMYPLPLPVRSMPPIGATGPAPGEEPPVPPSSERIDTLLFGPDTASLPSGKDSILGPLVVEALARHLSASIIGYASPDDDGPAAYKDALSRARAEAVRSRLIALGLPPGQIILVTGRGTAACARGGHLNKTICGRFRGVVIILGPAKAHGGR
jgi:outer membrane protein OmpA-like peptidoglycan-associated protein